MTQVLNVIDDAVKLAGYLKELNRRKLANTTEIYENLSTK
jgi:hypothetical protein